MMVLLPRRTEDQEHAHRRIEIVHNYAKLKSYEDDTSDSQSPNGSRNSSYLDDEEDDGDDDNEEDDYGEDDDMNDADYDAEEDEMIDLDGVYEDIIKRRKYPKLQKQTSMDVGGAFSRMVEKQTKPNATTTTSTTYNNINKRCPNLTIPQTKHHTITRKEHSDEDGDIHVDVDVETIDNPNLLNPTIATATITNCGISRGGDSVVNKPDHHARRPMNAFLIFCKRHRAIVKERYKNLENRAITKILGDWWASLDASDKECFTNLAQQNKDAFFSANPNFKWYKLPAPPLRTLNIRPNQIAEGGGNGDIMENGDGCGNYHHHHITTASHSNRNYFKLADEAQMGDLSQLMQNKSGPQQCALQQALGETSQFIRSHITGNVDDTELVETKSLKRPLYNENSFSSNSSEDDTLIPKKKISRSCKGKIYQELINSGQIAAPAIKKSKSMQRFTTELSSQQSNMCCSSDTPIMMGGHRYANEVNNQSIVNANNNNNNASMQMDRRNNFDLNSEATNTSSPDMVSFDLEEKIKELPALSLDEYLQRKRNTKKKKKFTTSGKKRSKCGNNTASGGQGTNGNKNQQPHYGTLEARIIQQRKQQQQAVGSQKRKARKESITRRDVSAIEEEVASLLPVTINGSCYYQEATTLPLSAITSSYKSNTKDMNSPSSPNSSKPTSPIIPLISTTATIMTTAAVTAVTPTSQRALSTPGGETEMSKESLTNNTNTLNDNISSTSDLLILAEVAANRTEKED
ncbi:putative uncharacterized protein DDB_G0282499 [Musca vetustissima]|uniref:putative uncharacterized protein DDB_G0282499 n=1 Tax=Musca vetustissima TaxID=27455 RepID=UPI002AB7A50B|nr:putative uncharacterized protein DDB_G0282499 [Musca vetustissima]